VIRTILIGLGAAAGTFILAAIGFAILDIYLSGHARPSPMKQMVTANTSVADVIALGLSVVAGALAIAWHSRQR
jgi:hypothetical protein